MELKTIKKTTKELELEISDENETILNPMIEVLLQNKDVEYASYITEHPESRTRRLYIRVKKGKPGDLLLKAVEQLEEEIKTFNKNFQDKIKSKK
jgi:DNA-directed RNA polymerase subunit L